MASQCPSLPASSKRSALLLPLQSLSLQPATSLRHHIKNPSHDFVNALQNQVPAKYSILTAPTLLCPLFLNWWHFDFYSCWNDMVINTQFGSLPSLNFAALPSWHHLLKFPFTLASRHDSSLILLNLSVSLWLAPLSLIHWRHVWETRTVPGCALAFVSHSTSFLWAIAHVLMNLLVIYRFKVPDLQLFHTLFTCWLDNHGYPKHTSSTSLNMHCDFNCCSSCPP